MGIYAKVSILVAARDVILATVRCRTQTSISQACVGVRCRSQASTRKGCICVGRRTQASDVQVLVENAAGRPSHNVRLSSTCRVARRPTIKQATLSASHKGAPHSGRRLATMVMP